MSNNFENFDEFLRLDPEERKEKISDLLADVTEPWVGTPEETLMLGIVGSMRSVMDAASNYAEEVETSGKSANQYILGIFSHTYVQQVRNFQTVAALSDMKRNLGGGA